MEEDILNKTINRARGTSGIPPGNIRKLYESGQPRPNAMEPISVDAMEPISVDAMEPISVDAMEPISVDVMEPISVDGRPPGVKPNNLKPGRVKFEDPPETAPIINNIGPITIYANTQEGGQAAARAFKEEMARRGVQFSR
jgi:hypothetical protein